MLDVAPDADSLAAVMGHEVAHATMQHGNQLILGALGLGTKLGLLGYSRLVARRRLSSIGLLTPAECPP